MSLFIWYLGTGEHTLMTEKNFRAVLTSDGSNLGLDSMPVSLHRATTLRIREVVDSMTLSDVSLELVPLLLFFFFFKFSKNSGRLSSCP